MRGNPSGNLVPECEPRKGVNWRLSVLDAQRGREDSADDSDTYSLVLDLIVIPKRIGLCKGRTKKVTERNWCPALVAFCATGRGL